MVTSVSIKGTHDLKDLVCISWHLKEFDQEFEMHITPENSEFSTPNTLNP